MAYLDLFTLGDVFITGTGVVVVSLMRIYYDSYMEKKKLKQFSKSLTVYNSVIEESQDGLLILSDNHEIIYSNNEAVKILHIDKQNLNSSYLNTIDIKSENDEQSQSLLKTIYSKSHIPHADMTLKGSEKRPVSLSINKVNASEENDYHWYVVTLHDLTSISELREASKDLLASA